MEWRVELGKNKLRVLGILSGDEICVEMYVTGYLSFSLPSLKVEELLKGLKALYCLPEKEEVASVDLGMVQE